ncbi:MAG: hypothetical protein H6815_04215 [Phycisphaeraceae bacterium]|nr:hypothetical protein [Phycisphaerales bacterium]MCB9859636.1 hypothetical protein [Phycisphaeraceae bacterium]
MGTWKHLWWVRVCAGVIACCGGASPVAAQVSHASAWAVWYQHLQNIPNVKEGSNQPEVQPSQPEQPIPTSPVPDNPTDAQPEQQSPSAQLEVTIAPKPALPDGYPDLEGVYERMLKAAETHPEICRYVDLTERLGTPATHEGRHLFAVKISDNPSVSENEPAVLIVANHHARELPAVMSALEAIDQLTSFYNADPSITNIVNNHEIWIAPMWNPDGYHYACTEDRMWRKNRRDNGDGTFGVDLNRNYPFGWGEACAGSNRAKSETYVGPSAASEPETQTMLAFAEAECFAKVADLHAFAGEVRFGYGCWAFPLKDFYQREAIRLSENSGMEGRHRTSCCLAGNIHYHMSHNGSYAALWEIGRSFNPPFPEAVGNAKSVFPGLLTMLHRPISISGRVYDAVTLNPINATIALPNAGYEHGETARSGGQYGRYHMVLPPGEHVLDFAAEGYESASIAISVTETSSQIYDMVLLPVTQSAGQQ